MRDEHPDPVRIIVLFDIECFFLTLAIIFNIFAPAAPAGNKYAADPDGYEALCALM